MVLKKNNNKNLNLVKCGLCPIKFMAFEEENKALAGQTMAWKSIWTIIKTRPIPAHSSIFQPLQAYASLFQPLPAYSSLFQPLSAYSSLLQTITDHTA